MAIRKIIRTIAFIELFIGITTIFGLIVSVLFSILAKPLNVFMFVMISAVISSILGIGIFRYNEKARGFLIFFSGYVLITKILIFSNLMQLSSEMITLIPSSLKNSVSIAYHAFIVLFFSIQNVKKEFVR